MNQSKLNQSIKSLLLSSIGFLLASGIATAQVEKNSDLFKTLAAKDSILFKIGFNKCEVDRSAELMFDDLEFYHDNSGISNSKKEFIEAMESGICRDNNPEKIYRHLVEESLEVFAMYDNGKLYGALQNGKHFFSTDENMTYEKTDNYALFSHLWIIDDGKWKLKRVISYNHVSKVEKGNTKKISVSKDILETYSGKYMSKTGEAIISIKDNTLQLSAGEMIVVLNATSENMFSHPKAPLTFEFIKNDKEEIIKMIVRENGKIAEEVKKIKN